jgi:hypothetical protein
MRTDPRQFAGIRRIHDQAPTARLLEYKRSGLTVGKIVELPEVHQYSAYDRRRCDTAHPSQSMNFSSDVS